MSEAAAVGGAQAAGLVVEIDLRVDSPNRHLENHFARHRRRAREHQAVAQALSPHTPLAPPFVVTFTRIASRLLDDDNVQAAFKAVRDQIGDWLGTGDGPKAPVKWEYAQEVRREREVRRGPCAPVPKHAFRSWIRVEIRSYSR